MLRLSSKLENITFEYHNLNPSQPYRSGEGFLVRHICMLQTFRSVVSLCFLIDVGQNWGTEGITLLEGLV